MARAAVTDPIRNFKFKVLIQPTTGSGLDTLIGTEVPTLGFSVVSGLTVQNEMIAYREGGMNTHPHKMVGQSDYGPVTFTKGVFAHQDAIYKWQQFMHSWGQGGLTAQEGSTSGNNDYRCDISVIVYDHPISAGSYSQPGTGTGQAVMTGAKLGYKLFNCWPASYSLGDLNAGDSSILIQQLVVNHEGFDILWADSADGNISEQDVANLA
jgi:phage tail-like protein